MRSYLVLVTVGLVLANVVQDALSSPQIWTGCMPGTRKVDNSGRRCVCSRSAVWDCQQRGKRDTQLEYKRCKPGDEWMEDCNRCSCAADGGAVCTMRLCGDTKIRGNRQSRCTPGESWKVKCNACTCSRDGRPRCTEKACRK